MILYDVIWTTKVNVLLIKCDCGSDFEYPSNYSLVECPYCKNKEVWHEDGLSFEELKKFKLVVNNITKQKSNK
jgi:hypothetical protein